MAKSKDIGNAGSDLINNVERDLNLFIQAALLDLSSEEEEGQEIRRAKLYITPNLIGDNQITFQDKVKLTYDGQVRTAQIYDIDTRKGGQIYLFTVLVRF